MIYEFFVTVSVMIERNSRDNPISIQSLNEIMDLISSAVTKNLYHPKYFS
jgi:hypothetical protein